MIDTDKYEGHTEGPWEQYSAAAYHAVVLPGDIELIPPKLADAQLIADAPLLLAEVKLLREVQKKIGSLICDECGLSIEEHIRYHTENDVIAGCPFGED